MVWRDWIPNFIFFAAWPRNRFRVTSHFNNFEWPYNPRHYKIRTPHICVTTIHDFQISIWFALRPAVFELHDILGHDLVMVLSKTRLQAKGNRLLRTKNDSDAHAMVKALLNNWWLNLSITICTPLIKNTRNSDLSGVHTPPNPTCSRLSTTHGHITDCKLDSVVHAGVCLVILMWTCLVWAEQSTADNFWVPSHRSNSATGEQKGITQTIYTHSEPPCRLLTH